MEEEYDREDSDEMELEPTPEELRRKELAQELKYVSITFQCP